MVAKPRLSVKARAADCALGVYPALTTHGEHFLRLFRVEMGISEPYLGRVKIHSEQTRGDYGHQDYEGDKQG